MNHMKIKIKARTKDIYATCCRCEIIMFAIAVIFSRTDRERFQDSLSGNSILFPERTSAGKFSFEFWTCFAEKSQVVVVPLMAPKSTSTHWPCIISCLFVCVYQQYKVLKVIDFAALSRRCY